MIHFKAILSITLIAALINAGNLKAQQNNPLINSGELIEKGVKLHDQEKYKEAVKLYLQIPKSDTNYHLALHEVLLSYFADSNYNACLPLIDEGVKYFPEKMFRWLNHKANVLDDMGKPQEALAVYDTLIKNFPNNLSAYFNKGITLTRLEKYDEAIPYFQQVLLIDPYYSSAHYQLGRLSYFKGNMVQAMMSFMANMLVNPSNNYQKNSLTFLSSIANVNDDATEVLKKYKPSKTDQFEALQEILVSKVAMDRKYKVLTDLDDKIIRQIQVVVEKAEFNAGDKGFWMQYYVPLYRKAFDDGYFEPMINFMFSNLDIDEIQKYKKKNEKEINKMATALREYLDEIKSTRVLELNKRAAVKIRYHYSDGNLLGKGEIIPGAKEVSLKGYWEFYHTNGALSSNGNYDDAGKRQGEWNYFYENSRLKEKTIFKDDKIEGLSLDYHDNGLLYASGTYKNSEIQGLKKTWYYNGILALEEEYKDGKRNGFYRKYTNRGFLEMEAQYADGKQIGRVKDYYNSGKISGDANLKDDEYDGPFKTWHENGKLKSEGAYTLGKKAGIWKTYFSNGKVETENTYVNNELDGESKEYYKSGTLFKKLIYKQGKLNGKVESFDEDGKIYSDIVYEKGRLKDVNFYNKNGAVISNTSSRRGEVNIVFFDANGTKTSIGNYDREGTQQGRAIYYYANGTVSVEAEYKNGFLNGKRVSYYANGAKKDEVNYTNDKLDGYYKEWHANGKLKEEGWYVDGERQGTHMSYRATGDLYSKVYYLNDDQYGFTEYYYANGKLDYTQRFEYDWIKAVSQYDTLGKTIVDISMPDGNSDFKFMNYNGKPMVDGKYRHNFLHGEYKAFYGDGNVRFINYYKHGLKDSLFTYYHTNGSLFYQGSYKLGEAAGTWKYYFDDGKINYVEEYKDGEEHGLQIIYNNDGTKDKEITYEEGQLHGPYKQYTDKNQLAIIFNYRYGDIVSYTYEGPDGKLVPPIVLKNFSGPVKAFYKNGKPSFETAVVNGAIHGKRVLYTSTGSVFIEGQRVLNSDEGEKKVYYANGQIEKHEFYVSNDLHGVRKMYYENGKLSAEENWYNGDLHGISKYYDDNGKLVELHTYYYGLLQKIEKK
jgi:uncharacterized protein